MALRVGVTLSYVPTNIIDHLITVQSHARKLGVTQENTPTQVNEREKNHFHTFMPCMCKQLQWSLGSYENNCLSHHALTYKNCSFQDLSSALATRKPGYSTPLLEKVWWKQGMGDIPPQHITFTLFQSHTNSPMYFLSEWKRSRSFFYIFNVFCSRALPYCSVFIYLPPRSSGERVISKQLERTGRHFKRLTTIFEEEKDTHRNVFRMENQIFALFLMYFVLHFRICWKALFTWGGCPSVCKIRRLGDEGIRYHRKMTPVIHFRILSQLVEILLVSSYDQSHVAYFNINSFSSSFLFW